MVPMLGDKRATLIVYLVLFSMIISILYVELVRGNLPSFYNIEESKAKVSYWDAPPDALTEPTTVIIVSPEENRTYTINNVTLIVNVGTQPIYDDGGANTHYIRSVLYNADWMESTERIFYHLADGLMAQKITITIDIDEIADGPHSLTVYASDSYDIQSPATVNFTIETQIQENLIPEFPSWTPLLIMLVAVVTVTVIFRRRLSTKNQGRIDQ